MSLDINAPDFSSTFDKTKACVGIVGQGFVGGATKAYFEKHEFKVVAYDKYRPEFGTLEDMVKQADIIFVCVPTPMRQSGQCYTGIVESVLDDVGQAAHNVGRPLDTFVVCVKSTVPAGFTERERKTRPDMRITFSPEFLTEANAVQDMLHANRIIVGGSLEDTRVVLQFFLEADRRRVDEGKCILMQCSSSVAEMAKLMGNGLLFAKVLLCNEIHALCQSLDIPYDEVRSLVALDPRIGASHTRVPGPDGHMGAGGHCFPKDMANLIFECEQLYVPHDVMDAVMKSNSFFRRNDKDWEEMKDRAVTDK